MSAWSNNGRWILWSLAPAILLTWIFSGCGKDSTIQISKNEVAQSYPLDGRGVVAAAGTNRVRLELKYDGAPDNAGAGSIQFEDGKLLSSTAGIVDFQVPENKPLLLRAAPTRGWQVKHWTVFPGTTANQTQTFLGNVLPLKELTDDQYVTVIFEKKEQAKFTVRIAGPIYHGGLHSYSGMVRWTVHLPGSKYSLDAEEQCHVDWESKTLEGSQCKPKIYPRGTHLKLEIIKRGGKLDPRNLVLLDDDVALDFTFTEAGDVTIAGDVEHLKTGSGLDQK